MLNLKLQYVSMEEKQESRLREWLAQMLHGKNLREVEKGSVSGSSGLSLVSL